MSYGYYYQQNPTANHQPYAYYSTHQVLQLPPAVPTIDHYSLRIRSNSQLEQNYLAKHYEQQKSAFYMGT